MVVYSLNKEEKQELIKLCENFENAIPEKELHYLEIAKATSILLPVSIKEQINDFINNQEPILLIKHLPIDENLIKTPINNSFHIGGKTMMGKISAIISEFIGSMVCYEAEGNGKLFQDMVPNKKLSNSQTSLSSKVELELHTEQAFSDLRPDYLNLACLRGNNEAKTYYLPMDVVLENMNKDELIQLNEKNWYMGVDLSFMMNGCENNKRGPLSLFTNNSNFVFDQDLLISTNSTSKYLVDKIINLYYKYRKHIVLEPGDLLIINNNNCVHGRSSFTPNYDGYDRFIVRSFIMTSLDKIKDKAMKNRMILKEFS